MKTFVIMLFVLGFLGITLLAGLKVTDGRSTHFFDRDNTNALRGFWCLVVMLVHVPSLYQNRIQDMIGSFAYIGVTFFFMTSAYGLRLLIEKNPDSINVFWRKRLPKLLVPCFLVKIIGLLTDAATGNVIILWNLVSINGWVQWLVVCYFIFWMSYKFIGGVSRYSYLYLGYAF